MPAAVEKQYVIHSVWNRTVKLMLIEMSNMLVFIMTKFSLISKKIK